jgi:hypothetical protein
VSQRCPNIGERTEKRRIGIKIQNWISMPKQFDESFPLHRCASLHNVVTKHPRLVIAADQILGRDNVVE